MRKNFNIHGTSVEVKSGREDFMEFLKERYRQFETGGSSDIEVEVKFEKPDFDREDFSSLGAGTSIDGKRLTYSRGPLDLLISDGEILEIEAFLNPKKWKHYGRILKKGRERTWNEYYEYFLIRKGIQLPMMWKLQQEGFYPLHASAVEKDGKAYVFTGFPGAGKTTLGLYLAENGYRLLGDNFVFMKDGKLYPYPEMLRVNDFTLQKIPGLRKTGRKVFGQHVAEIDDSKISSKPVKLEKAFIINRGKPERKDIENPVDRFLTVADMTGEFHTHSYASFLSFLTDERQPSREQIYRDSLKKADTEMLTYSNLEEVRRVIEEK